MKNPLPVPSHDVHTSPSRAHSAVKTLIGGRLGGSVPCRGLTPSALNLRAMLPDEAEYWLARVKSLCTDCGCRVGAAFLLAAFVLYPLLWYWFAYPLQSVRWYLIPGWISAAFLSAVLGKAIGIGSARWRLRLLVRRVRSDPLRSEGPPRA